MKKLDCNNALRMETFDLPVMARPFAEANDKPLRMALTTPQLFSPRSCLLVGCGDSYCAGVAAKPLFEQLGGIRTEALSAMEASRHWPKGRIGNEPCNPLLYVISASGNVSRNIEVCQRAAACGVGALTVAVTAHPDSPMAKASQAVLPISPTPFDSGFDEHSPGLRSYYASLYALCSSAIRMGEVKTRYPMSQADDYRRAMVEYAESFGGEVMEQIDDAMFALAQQWQEFDSFEFLGSGAQMATTWFDAAKIYEATGDVATYEDMENWCHVNYFARDHRRVGTVLSISKDSPAMVRALEVAEVLARLRPTLIVTDADAALFPKEATVCQLPSPRYGFLAPLMDYVPVALLSGYLARLKGVSLFRGGEPAFQSQPAHFLKTSQIEIV